MPLWNTSEHPKTFPAEMYELERAFTPVVATIDGPAAALLTIFTIIYKDTCTSDILFPILYSRMVTLTGVV